MVRVLLLDEHPVVRRGIGVLLAVDPAVKVIAEATTPAEAELLIALRQPDVLILDLLAPPRPALSLIPALKRKFPDLGILIVTGEPADLVLVAALEAGAHGFINKNRSAPEYVEAIRRVAGQELYLCPCALQALVKAFFDRERMRDRVKLDSLSETERLVLLGMVSGLRNAEIAESLHAPVATIEKLKSHVRDKLDLHRREDLVAFALRVGLLNESHRDLRPAGSGRQPTPSL